MYKKNRENEPISAVFGKWRINWMEMWDEEYLNMEVRPFIEIDKNLSGRFQFGLVSGAINGEIGEGPNGPKIEFTFEGSDEMDECNGSGWIRLKSKNLAKGRFKFHSGDASNFEATRIRYRPSKPVKKRKT